MGYALDACRTATLEPKKMSQQLIQATRVSLSEITEAPWNVNVMSPAKFQDLLRDMKAAGPEGTDPIDTAEIIISGIPTHVTIDGAHRLRAAKEIGWDHLYEIFHHEITGEEEARLFNYKRDADRGDIDPFKLAESFKWFVQKGESQEQIAAKFGVDRTTVSRRLSLLNLDQEVKKHVLIREGLTVSHLEPIAALEPQLQKAAAKQLQQSWSYRQSVPTVKAVEQDVIRIKQNAEREKKFAEAVKNAKFPKCPVCKKPPRLTHMELPNVECSADYPRHTWNLQTGKDPYATPRPMSYDQRAQIGHRQVIPQHFKSQHTFGEYVSAVRKFVGEAWPKFDIVQSVHVTGKVGGKTTRLTVDIFDGNVSYSIGTASLDYEIPGGRVYFRFRRNTTKNKSFQTYVEGGQLKNKEAIKALEERASKFLEDYAPRGTRK